MARIHAWSFTRNRAVLVWVIGIAALAAHALSPTAHGQTCGDPDAGNCCEWQPTPTCSDEECCTITCAIDPYCCATQWDDFCVNIASVNCPSCGGGGGAACGDVSAGSCCTAHATPFCADSSCCSIICVVDPFCCATMWDQACANVAVNACAACGAGGACGEAASGDCCTPHATASCDDAVCCVSVCAVDSYCCTTEWDSYCSNMAHTTCASCVPPPPANDLCAAASALIPGITGFSTAGATGETLGCKSGGNPSIFNDIWYAYESESSGLCSISLCGSSFDTKLAVFETDCAGALIVCNDDSTTLCKGTSQSSVEFNAVCGSTYLVCVGAFHADGTGSGDIALAQLGDCAPPCPADLNGDGSVTAADVSSLLAAWGSAGGDINGDGATNAADLSALLAGWGACP